MDSSADVLVPPVVPGLAGVFGLAVDQDWVYVFDPLRAGESARLLALDESGSGGFASAITHGVSAVDEISGVAYLVRGRGLVALDLVQPAVLEIALRGGNSLGGFVSMEWDPVGVRLLGLAVLDGYTLLAQVDPLQGAVSPLSELPPCGDMDCSPAQGVSALDASGSGAYYAASSRILYAFSASNGSLIWYSTLAADGTIVDGTLEEDLGGLTSLEFGPMAGLVGVAVRGDAVELVAIGTGDGHGVRGVMRMLVRVFDSALAGSVVAGVSAYRSGGPGSLGWYYLVSEDRFLAADLDTGIVSQFRPSQELAPSQLALMALIPFLAPASSAGAELGAIADARPPAAPAPDIGIVGVSASLPLSASFAFRVSSSGVVLKAQSYTFTVVGADVAAGDSLLLALLGDCGTPVAGGGPYAILSAGVANVTMVLSFVKPALAQFCYRRRGARDSLYQTIQWGGVNGEAGPALEVPLTVASFVVCEVGAMRIGKCPLAVVNDKISGATLSVGVKGPLSSGDSLALVEYIPTLPVDTLCESAQTLAASDLSELYGIINDAGRSAGPFPILPV